MVTIRHRPNRPPALGISFENWLNIAHNQGAAFQTERQGWVIPACPFHDKGQ
jgi:hypothetical protein